MRYAKTSLEKGFGSREQDLKLSSREAGSRFVPELLTRPQSLEVLRVSVVIH